MNAPTKAWAWRFGVAAVAGVVLVVIAWTFVLRILTT